MVIAELDYNLKTTMMYFEITYSAPTNCDSRLVVSYQPFMNRLAVQIEEDAGAQRGEFST